MELPPRDRRPDGLGDFFVLPDEIICESILPLLTPCDVSRLSCASSVMYILCNEEPLWMSLCLNNVNHHLLEYKNSWKQTTLHELQVLGKCEEPRKPLHFNGFNSLFLYKRLYRCYTQLDGFSFDNGNVQRRAELSLEEFLHQYDGKKPVLISGLADNWPARKTWNLEQLSLKYGGTTFRISHRSSRKISMKFKDYVSYMELQHDEDPLYIFDDKFGEVEPDLLKDYSVPHLFQDDYFDILDRDQRPSFRWFIIGPERSGASWHVDPALTSAWNTLLCGRKRWALYPPGRVPMGVTVHVNDEDGDVNIDTPSSLQWWLDYYPLLADEDKPIECTQLPGETIYVPSGWWHCVLNLEATVAVTQNYVNSNNFEFVCLDMAPGYQHKGVCRAGLLALDEDSIRDGNFCVLDDLIYLDQTRKEKRIKICESFEDSNRKIATNGASKSYTNSNIEFSYDINFLSLFLDKERDHYNSLWSSNNCIGQREMREWLWKLWVGKPGLRDLIWKGACLALNASKWSRCMEEICSFHQLPLPSDDEKLPVGTGSNPVYLVADNVIKIFLEEGLESTLHSLNTELEFYSLLERSKSTLKNYVPDVLASGIIFLENGSFTIVPWDGKGLPDVISRYNEVQESLLDVDYPFGIWTKKQFEYRKANMTLSESLSRSRYPKIWPYVVTRRCKGKIFAELRDTLSWEEILNLASFLGKQLHDLHLLPVPSLKESMALDVRSKFEIPHDNVLMKDDGKKVNLPAESELFFRILNRKKKDVSVRLVKWGHPIPNTLIENIDEYLPTDFTELLNMFKDENDLLEVCNQCSWIHTDIMDDNIIMEQCGDGSFLGERDANGAGNLVNSGFVNGSSNGKRASWCPSYILDFSNLSLGDPILDLIPIYLDIFRGEPQLLKHFLESYQLPTLRRRSYIDKGGKVRQISYLAMCYCIIHEDNILGAIFDIWKELRTAKSWEEVENTVWGGLNNYM